MNLVFENQKLKSLEQFPIEKEYLREDVFDIKRFLLFFWIKEVSKIIYSMC